MKKVIFKSLKAIHLAIKPNSSSFGRNWKLFPNKEYASTLISRALTSKEPTMIARLGAVELTCLVNYLGVSQKARIGGVRNYIANKSPPWWWEPSVINQMATNAGFFPLQIGLIEKFCEIMISDLTKVDILGSWLKEESFFHAELIKSKKVMLEDLEPFFTPNPWTQALEGKKVLVVHPFADTIKNQYTHREKLFPDGLLPQFELEVIPSVQSIAGQKTQFKDWFEALDSMKEKIAMHDFDVCILGCGAYGFPCVVCKGYGEKFNTLRWCDSTTVWYKRATLGTIYRLSVYKSIQRVLGPTKTMRNPTAIDVCRGRVLLVNANIKLGNILRIILMPVGLAHRVYQLAIDGSRDILNYIRFHKSIIDQNCCINPTSSIAPHCRILQNTVLINSNIESYTYIGKNSIVQNAHIGSFSSIANNVMIGLGSHPTNLFSTSPIFYRSINTLKVRIIERNFDYSEYHSIEIGNDVWIGARATILDGVKIGHGAIIAAGSIVTKDVLPYAIVAGVPAKLIRFRFDTKKIDALLELAWWQLPITEIKLRIEELNFL